MPLVQAWRNSRLPFLVPRGYLEYHMVSRIRQPILVQTKKKLNKIEKSSRLPLRFGCFSAAHGSVIVVALVWLRGAAHPPTPQPCACPSVFGFRCCSPPFFCALGP